MKLRTLNLTAFALGIGLVLAATNPVQGGAVDGTLDSAGFFNRMGPWNGTVGAQQWEYDGGLVADPMKAAPAGAVPPYSDPGSLSDYALGGSGGNAGSLTTDVDGGVATHVWTQNFSGFNGFYKVFGGDAHNVYGAGAPGNERYTWEIRRSHFEFTHGTSHALAFGFSDTFGSQNGLFRTHHDEGTNPTTLRDQAGNTLYTITDVGELENFRVAVLGDDGTGRTRANIYVNNVLVAEDHDMGPVTASPGSANFFIAVSFGSAGLYETGVDYARIDTTGAFAPPGCDCASMEGAILDEICSQLAATPPTSSAGIDAAVEQITRDVAGVCLDSAAVDACVADILGLF